MNIKYIIYIIIFILFGSSAFAQQDTFFLAKKRGLLGKLGKSISTNPPLAEPIRIVNPYLQYKGKIIRHIEFLSVGFDRDIYDTTLIRDNLGIRLANTFHTHTTKKVLSNNLFFKEGDKVYPLLLADNERHLRETGFLKDAKILIDDIPDNKDSVDVIVITKDVFSIGGNIDISSNKKAEANIREENLAGRAIKLSVSGLYDRERSPQYGWGAEVRKKNIAGSFIDVTIGGKNFSNAFNSGKNEETSLYAKVEKPLVSAYLPTTWSIEAAYNKTANNYLLPDSLFRSDYRYNYYNIDGWYGYSLGRRNLRSKNLETRIRAFLALRVFYQKFDSVPASTDSKIDYRYINSNGLLASFNVFRQNFYKANFIYGFGIYEDVPEGFSFSFTSGVSNKQNRKRPYAGLDFLFNHYNKKGFYTTYTFRVGSNFYRKRFEDVELLANVDHITRLKYVSHNWLNRSFFSAGLSTQINPFVNAPLFLNSAYGLPYFNNGYVAGDVRATVKAESVLYSINKLLGFRFAPFAFVDASVIKPYKENINKTELYSALGGGIRARNENLVFGTMELRGYYFPRVNEGYKNWKIEFATGLRFRFFSQFIHRPDFVITN